MNKSPVSEKVILLTAGIGMFLSTLDTGIINVALPSLEQEFHTDVTSIAWAITLYLTVISGSIVAFGRLADRYGHVKLYTWGLVVFGLGSIFCGFSYSVGELLLFRTIQGVGAAIIQAIAAALITTLIASERRGAAIGTLGVTIGLGPILGPTVGGVLISTIGWRWIFWINIPFCLAGLWGCGKLNHTAQRREYIPFDTLGNLLFSSAVLALLWGLSLWSKLGAGNLQTIAYIILFVVLSVIFLIREQRSTHPILDLRLLGVPSFTTSFLATAGFGVASAIIFVIPPYFLQTVKHLVPWQVGLVLLSAPLGVVVMARFSGKLSEQLGTSKLMVVGLATMLAALLSLSHIQSNWHPLMLAFLLLVYGMGGGIFQPPNIAAVMGAVTVELQGTIGSVQRMVQNVSIAFGTAVSAAFIQLHTTSMGTDKLMLGFRDAWLFAVVVILLNLLSFGFSWSYRR